MDVRCSYPNLFLASQVQTIVLDTSDALKDFVIKVFYQGGLEDLTELDKYLDNIFEDLADREEAIYELTYRAYEMLEGDDKEETLSTAYEKLARRVYQTLIEANAYTGQLLRFRFFRLIGDDIVMVLSSRHAEEDYSENSTYSF